MKERIGLWFCRSLGWHPYRYRTHIRFDGMSMHEKCERCEFVGMVDSSGSLF